MRADMNAGRDLPNGGGVRLTIVPRYCRWAPAGWPVVAEDLQTLATATNEAADHGMMWFRS